jgi:hypothetical protein
MKKLTKNQKEFILNHFFKNDSYPGWKNIGISLLENGYSIVAGNGCIWHGGIGNFIKLENTTEFIDCTKYIFDLDNFLTSAWYKEISDNYIDILKDKKIEISKKLIELEEEYNEILEIK